MSDHAARSDTENRFILRTDISADMNMALNRMTFMTGTSKATIVREAIALYMVTVGAETAETILAEAPSPTRGRLSSAQKRNRKVRK